MTISAPLTYNGETYISAPTVEGHHDRCEDIRHLADWDAINALTGGIAKWFGDYPFEYMGHTPMYHVFKVHGKTQDVFIAWDGGEVQWRVGSDAEFSGLKLGWMA
jgi:hypothetical protein